MTRHEIRFLKRKSQWFHCGTIIVLWMSIAPTARCLADDAEQGLLDRGAAIYAESCAACHGEQGQGVADSYPDPLLGDSTSGELAKLIADTMPEEEPEACVGEDAQAVAAYIHHAFYSEAAQIRTRPPRIGLARLTGEQLRQSLADLYARVDGVASTTPGLGIAGTYFKGAGWKDENKKIERNDPVIDFDFGLEGPGEGIEGDDFYIHWSGAIRADVSGRYEFVIHSSSAFEFYFGDSDRILINNRVQSGDQTEFRASLHLTGGRVYPIRIEFFQRKRKTEQPPSSIRLAWVPPRGIEHTIPTANLLPDWNPPAFPLQTKLPPDDRSYGYDRGIAINRDWDDSTTSAALEFAEMAIKDLWPRYQRKHKKDADEDRAKLRAFLTDLVQTALRGELDDATRNRYIDDPLATSEDDSMAIKRVLLLTLKSPRFLYPQLDMSESPSVRAANRVALVLFDSLPAESWLVDAGRKGQLNNEQKIRDAATRMVVGDRAKSKTRAMLYEWLNLSHMPDISKDAEAFPGFDSEIVGDLRLSLDAFLDEVVWSENSDFRQLLQADWTFTTDRLATFYGDAWKPAEGETGKIQRSVGDASTRHGVLTHPLMMSGLAYFTTTSPIHRGVFLVRRVLGRTLRPPNAAFSPLSPDLHPDLTTRERVELQTSPESCQVCHVKINALGFALENYDAIGRFRESEHDKPVDASGQYLSRSGAEATFNGAAELADYLATSDDCHRAFVARAFEHFAKQPIAAYGPDRLDRLTRQFQESGFNIRQLIIEIATIAASQTLATDSPA